MIDFQNSFTTSKFAIKSSSKIPPPYRIKHVAIQRREKNLAVRPTMVMGRVLRDLYSQVVNASLARRLLQIGCKIRVVLVGSCDVSDGKNSPTSFHLDPPVTARQFVVWVARGFDVAHALCG